MTTTAMPVTRRDFVKAGAVAGAGLTIGFTLTGCGPRGAEGVADVSTPPVFLPNAFVRIGEDGHVLVLAKHLEMGQGSYTGLATLVAEELDADWSKVRVEGAPADVSKYANLAFGVQGTGGSTAMANSYEQMRMAGATARAMLVAAAAAEWKVDATGLTTEKGVVTNPANGKRATYGSLAAKAATLPVPEKVALKDPANFRLIGKTAPRVDMKSKSTGTAMFTQDFTLPGMLTAVVAHPPRFGAKVKSFDSTAATAVPGVQDVVQIPNGVAVLATGFYAAKQGRDALIIEWDESGSFTKSSSDIMAEYKVLAGKRGTLAKHEGNAERVLASAKGVVSASYEFPFLAHATMEPLNCVVKLGTDSCEIWNGEQFQTPDQFAVAQVTGLKQEQVSLNMLFAGGSFGRRASPTADYVIEAVTIAQAIKGRVPVKLVWTREDDMRAGYYRPAYLHAIRGAVDASGAPSAWHHRVVGQSIMTGSAFAGMIQNGIDPTSVEGAADMPYTIPNQQVELHTTTLPVPIQWWRSVGHTHTAFAVECFLDELAAAAGKDPVDFRRALLTTSPRHLGVLNVAAEKAGWGTPLPAGRARGVAVHQSFNSFVAEVAEVSIEAGKVKVHRVVCAVDCGVAINPENIRAQMESGIAFGLSAALHGAITLKDGKVEQSNFDGYQVLRINEMPVVEVHIVPSTEKPTGVGEPGTPPIAPAVANAIFKLTGKPVRALPIVL
jgi:isoquinoline 1-oxidoreductase beta subunit